MYVSTGYDRKYIDQFSVMGLLIYTPYHPHGVPGLMAVSQNVNMVCLTRYVTTTQGENEVDGGSVEEK